MRHQCLVKGQESHSEERRPPGVLHFDLAHEHGESKTDLPRDQRRGRSLRKGKDWVAGEWPQSVQEA